MYIIMFHHLYLYHKETTYKNSLGLSKETIEKRKNKNVMTFFGQFLSFFIETGVTIAMQVVVSFQFESYMPIIITMVHSFTAALLVITFVLASPELRRFYFRSSY